MFQFLCYYHSSCVLAIVIPDSTRNINVFLERSFSRISSKWFLDEFIRKIFRSNDGEFVLFYWNQSLYCFQLINFDVLLPEVGATGTWKLLKQAEIFARTWCASLFENWTKFCEWIEVFDCKLSILIIGLEKNMKAFKCQSLSNKYSWELHFTYIWPWLNQKNGHLNSTKPHLYFFYWRLTF